MRASFWKIICWLRGVYYTVWWIYMPSLVDIYTQHGASIYPARWIYMPTKPEKYALISRIFIVLLHKEKDL